MPTYDIEVQLTGEDGNAFFMIGRVRKALRQAGVSPDELNSFVTDATSGDYAHVLETIEKWVHVA